VKIFFTYCLVLILSLNTLASSLQCSNLFSQFNRGSVESLAYHIDLLNESKANGQIFSQSLSGILYQQSYYKPSFKKVAKTYYQRKLKSILNELNKMDQNTDSTATIDQYELDILIDRLLRLSFINDPSINNQLSTYDKNIIFNAKKSILSYGLLNYFFKDIRKMYKKETKIKIIFELILKPFRDEYFRWTYAMLIAPKLRGSVIPAALAEKILLDGLEAHRDELKPYLTTIHGKHIFNKLSSFYNWFIVFSIASIIPAGMYYYNQIKQDGINKAVKQLHEVELSTRKTAEITPEQIAAQFHLANMVNNLQIKYNRKLTSEEIEVIKKYISDKYKVSL